MKIKQTGFTLIELIVSMALGSIVIASAIGIYTYAIRGSEIQQSSFENQMSMDQAFTRMTDSIRRATMYKNERFTASNYENVGIITYPSQYSTRNTYDRIDFSQQNSGDSNVEGIKSDQLVVRYRPMKTGGYDCEGNQITDTQYDVVEKYHVALSPSTGNLGLFCDAGRFHFDKGVIGMGTNTSNLGMEIASNVDLFKVRIVMQMEKTTIANSRYYGIYDIPTYNTVFQGRATGTDIENKFKIIGVQVGLVTHSQGLKTNKPKDINTQDFLYLMGKPIKINGTSESKSDPNQYVATQQIVSTANGVGDL